MTGRGDPLERPEAPSLLPEGQSQWEMEAAELRSDVVPQRRLSQSLHTSFPEFHEWMCGRDHICIISHLEHV